MDIFKIRNIETAQEQVMNELDMIVFFKINDISKYTMVNLTNLATQKRNRLLDKLAAFCIFAASILTTIIYINSYY